MGMYDDIRCDYPLPAPGANDLTGYQTKDTPAQECDLYVIDKDGGLHHEEYDIEDRSDPNADGLYRLIGMMTRTNARLAPVNDFTGEIRFYTIPAEGQWIEFSSYFIDGKMQSVTLIEDTRPTPAAQKIAEGDGG